MTGHVFTAQLLRASADGFAGIAASRLFEADPDLAERHAPDAFETWRTHLRVQVDNLASAVGDGLPEGFARHVTWARTAFEGRGLAVDELASGLDCLRGVLEEELPAAAWGPLPEYFERATVAARAATETPAGLPDGTPAGALAQELVDLLLAGEQRTAREAVLAAVEGGMDRTTALDQVLVPALHEVGRLWHLGEIGVGEEHFATGVVRRLLARLLEDAPVAPSNGRTVLVAAVAGDAHDLATQLVAGFFDLDGWRALDLGSDVPVSDLTLTAARFGADLVALSATLDVQRDAAAAAIAALRATRPDLPVMVGGPAFDASGEAWRATGANAHVRRASEAPRVARGLLGL